MPGEPINPMSNLASTEMEKHKDLDHEIRDMISALTKRLSELQHMHKSVASASSHGQHHGDSSHHRHHLGYQDDEDHHGLRIITLAGSNQGVTMHGELMDEKSANPEDVDPYEALGTYVNSNFQAINNSIMMGGSYTTNDPGVHLDISDLMDHQHRHYDHDPHPGEKDDAGEKMGKKKHRDNGKSKQDHSEKSDEVPTGDQTI